MSTNESENEKGQLFLGGPMWQHKAWKETFFSKGASTKEGLKQYASYYNTVEGNTSFYAMPTKARILHWLSQVGDGFQFSFKLSQEITHKNGIDASFSALKTFFDLMDEVKQAGKLAHVHIQLPPSFSADKLHTLERLFQDYAGDFPLSVEVRHLSFFDKAMNEIAFNRLLMAHQVDRVMLDSRPVHSELIDNNTDKAAEIIDAQKKKPKLPLHVLATGHKPVIRYIGKMNLDDNRIFIQSWLKTLNKWIAEGRNPYLYIHTADNAKVHDLAELWLKMLHEQLGYRPYKRQALPYQVEQEKQAQRRLF